MGESASAEWIDDGFLVPAEARVEPRVDAHNVRYVPVHAITQPVAFARVRVAWSGTVQVVLLVGPDAASTGLRTVEGLGAHLAHDVVGLLGDARRGGVEVLGRGLPTSIAVASANSNYRNAWDDSEVVCVRSAAAQMRLGVTFDPHTGRFTVKTCAL